ncbi:MAG: hypothetical protein P1P88_24735, partial [Bacteroidales bacterium]|nr:hypothetical protein [Bacteroidales bacterium]
KLMFVMVNDKKISPDFEIFHKYSDYIGRSPLGIVNLTFNKSADKIAYLVNFSSSEGDLIARKEAFYLMINEKQILPKMYAASLFSINQGELFYAGIDSSDFILHHVKIDF